MTGTSYNLPIESFINISWEKTMNYKKQNTYIKLTYPDGDIEFWSLDSDVKELERLQKLHNNNIKIEYVGGY